MNGTEAGTVRADGPAVSQDGSGLRVNWIPGRPVKLTICGAVAGPPAIPWKLSWAGAIVTTGGVANTLRMR